MEGAKPKNSISYYVMSDDQIAEICRVAGEAGGKAALKKYREEAKNKHQERIDRRYHNTELLLKNYTKLKLSVENAVFDIHQVEEEQSVREILDLMTDREDSYLLIQSVKTSKAKTAIIVKHIEKMIEVYRSYCENSFDELDRRRYQILIDRYFTTPSIPVKKIAEIQSLSEDSVYNDLKCATDMMTTLIFGIDGALIERGLYEMT